MRQRTMEPTTGRELVVDVCKVEGVGVSRGTEMVGFVDLDDAGMVTMEPMIEAYIFDL